METINLCIVLLAPVVGQAAVLLNATLGSSVLIPCYLPATVESLKRFYWQEDGSDSILFTYGDDKSKPTPNYENRVQGFDTEILSGNISIRINNITVADDQKSFWAIADFKDKNTSRSERWKKHCNSTLQVSAPYQDLVLTIDNTSKRANCTAHGGYPEAEVFWSGQNKSSDAQVDLQGAETFHQQDPEKKTFTVISSVSVKGLQSVTCGISNQDTQTSRDILADDEVSRAVVGVGVGVGVGVAFVVAVGFCGVVWRCKRPLGCRRRRSEEPRERGNDGQQEVQEALRNEGGEEEHEL